MELQKNVFPKKGRSAKKKIVLLQQHIARVVSVGHTSTGEERWSIKEKNLKKFMLEKEYHEKTRLEK